LPFIHYGHQLIKNTNIYTNLYLKKNLSIILDDFCQDIYMTFLFTQKGILIIKAGLKNPALGRTIQGEFF